jgi:S-DNA-T family DNA segregation ATPase FtsK/SpoIIIE
VARPDEGADIGIADPAVPPLAVRVIIGPGGWQLAPFGGARVMLDGQLLDGGAYWRPGQQVAVGNTLLELAPYEPPDAALHPAEQPSVVLLAVGNLKRRHGF